MQFDHNLHYILLIDWRSGNVSIHSTYHASNLPELALMLGVTVVFCTLGSITHTLPRQIGLGEGDGGHTHLAPACDHSMGGCGAGRSPHRSEKWHLCLLGGNMGAGDNSFWYALPSVHTFRIDRIGPRLTDTHVYSGLLTWVDVRLINPHCYISFVCLNFASKKNFHNYHLLADSTHPIVQGHSTHLIK